MDTLSVTISSITNEFHEALMHFEDENDLEGYRKGMNKLYEDGGYYVETDGRVTLAFRDETRKEGIKFFYNY